MDSADSAKLASEDFFGVARLKYLRNRTLMKSKKRDPQYLKRMATPRHLQWDPEGPMMPSLLALQNAVDEYVEADAGEDKPQAEMKWLAVLDSVNDVIHEGERIQGERIKPRAS